MNNAYFVDGPDGTGKSGYARFIAEQIGAPCLEMTPVESMECIEEKSAVFNSVLRQLHAAGVTVVVDRGPVSSIVHSRIEGRENPEHAWETLTKIDPTIFYLRCDASELAIRYQDPDDWVDEERLEKLVHEYDKVMTELIEAGYHVVDLDTSSGIPEEIVETLDKEATDAL